MDTALHTAAKKGNVALVQLLVEADPSDPHTQNNQGETPIYIAAESGYYDIVKMICTTSTGPLNLDTPGGATLLHVLIKNLCKGNKECIDVIRMIFNIISKRYHKEEWLVQFYNRSDENGCTILELAVDGNYIELVELISEENPTYLYLGIDWRQGHPNLIGIVPLIYKAMDKEYSEMVNLLADIYGRGVEMRFMEDYASVPRLISAIRSRKQDSFFDMMYYAKNMGPHFGSKNLPRDLVTYADNLGWTILHHAVYHEFDLIIEEIVEVQKMYEHPFKYNDKISTPFHIAAERRYTSTMILLMQSWPSSSSAYTALDKNGNNILHIAAMHSEKEMIEGILKHCHEEFKKEFVNRQDNNGNTPLHLLIMCGCFIPELLTYEGFDMNIQNKKKWTAPDMLYIEDRIIGDQLQIKIALDSIQINHTRDMFSSIVLPSKRMKKDVLLNKEAKLKTHEKYARMKEDNDVISNCFADAIAGDAISKAALKIIGDKLNESRETILHTESKKGDTENVRFIVHALANKSLFGKLDRSGQTALHLAADHGHTEVVEVLVDAAKRYLPSSANDDTHNSVCSFQDFIRKASGPMKNTALHLAVINDNVAMVRLLVQADPDDRHVQNEEGKTPIYIAAENGYKDIIMEICTTCKALSLDGLGRRTTALHVIIQHTGQVAEGASNMIRMIVNAAKRWSSAEDPSLVKFKELFSRTDESGSTVLQLAVENNFVDAVKLILPQDPAYQPGPGIKTNGLMCLIHKAIDNGYSKDIIELLSKAYVDGIDPKHKDVLDLILAIQRLDEGSVLHLLKDARHLVTFEEDNGWTPLHYAVYHEFDSILQTIINAQKDEGHTFVYGNMESMPFYTAVKYGYTSTLLRLMELWPASSPASRVASFPYTVVNNEGQNILHLAAASDSRKEMVQGIFKYCPEMYKDEILNQQDINNDTPLHLLISHGCFIPQLINHKGFNRMAKNNQEYTPRDMLYVKDDIVADQVHIKIALDDVMNNQSVSKLWGKRAEKNMDIWKCNKTPPSKGKKKDMKFEECKKKLMEKEHEQMKKDLETYKTRTNTQILVTALITTVTFTVGFTMPGGLHPSGEVDEGLVVLSKKKAFNIFMISDALALLMSVSSLFFYFLESMNEDPRQVSLLNASSTVLNILSIIGMMLTFIAGTYVVLSDTPVLAMAICIICSLFFLLILIVWIIKKVYDRHVKKNKD